MFRIKCLNKLLPTRDICYQRRLRLYKGKTCIACYRTEETFNHLAVCEIYQKIWKHTEEIIIEELRHKIFKEWSISVSSSSLTNILLGTDSEEKLKKRKLHLRGLTSRKQSKGIKTLLSSKSKSNRTICWFIDIFWSNFYERLWKFRCEVMTNWEKENGINTRKKKEKGRKQMKTRTTNKENIILEGSQKKETTSEKQKKILNESNNQISRWIKGADHEKWLKFKTN